MSELFQQIGNLVAEQGEAYFVGGCVRDLLLGAPVKDVDFVLRGDPHATGRALANTYSGHVFWLREEDQAVRVLLPEQNGLQIDLLPLRTSLEADLRARDLTINAMAAPAGSGLSAPEQVLDPLGGRADLDARVIRFCSPASPENDPLRTLRALRFRWKLGFGLADETEARLRECVPLLERVSTERIRDELFQLLAMPCAADALAEAWTFGFAPWLTGARIDGGGAAPAERVRSMEAVLAHIPPSAAKLFAREVTAPRRRREVLLWAAALQPLVPSVDPAAAARHLALSSDERQLISKGLSAAETARNLVRRWFGSGRARYRLWKQAGTAGPEAVLLAAAADGWSAEYAELLDVALHQLFYPEPPLLTGIEVMQAAGIEPGPLVGQLLEGVEEARADGLLRSKAEAVQWLRERVRDLRRTSTLD